MTSIGEPHLELQDFTQWLARLIQMLVLEHFELGLMQVS